MKTSVIIIFIITIIN